MQAWSLGIRQHHCNAMTLVVALLLHSLVLAMAAAGGRFDYDAAERGFSHVFSFGDSLADTGNGLHLPAGRASTGSLPPYGMTYFHRPTGRCSDGRLTVDFVVEALKVPFLKPYLAGEAAGDFRYGASFAVGGATAHGAEFFKGVGLQPFVPVSLATEMAWFSNVLHLLAGASAQEREKITARSLFVVWEIGGNDYLIALKQNRTLHELKTFVPGSVDIIRSALRELIGAGARTMVVQGMLPLGCEPRLLELFRHGRRAGDYDPSTGCLTSLNDLAEEHNRALTGALHELRQLHPGTAIAYADYYRAVTDIAASHRKYGFGGSPLFSCCGGGGGPYNVNLTASCSSGASTACADPSEYVSWDGVHYTEAANRVIAGGILHGPYAAPPILSMHVP